MTGHPSRDELADLDAGLLAPERAAELAEHVDGCRDCAAEVEALTAVRQTLATDPTPSMPPEVFARLAGVVAAESSRRVEQQHRPAETGATGPATSGGLLDDIHHHQLLTPVRRTSLGRLEDRLPSPGIRGALGKLALTFVVAAVLGFGGYVVSARAGLNEPVASNPVAINPSTLGQQASALDRGDDLSPHRFSNAWRCARQVTSGRITGIRAVTVDGQSAYLVFLAGDPGTRVVVVRDCGTETPTAGPSAVLPHR